MPSHADGSSWEITIAAPADEAAAGKDAAGPRASRETAQKKHIGIGRDLFRYEPRRVDGAAMKSSLEQRVADIIGMSEKLDRMTEDKTWQVDEMTFSLTILAKGGFAFLTEFGGEVSASVTLRRKA